MAEYTIGPFIYRDGWIEPGQSLEWHEHNFDHVTHFNLGIGLADCEDANGKKEKWLVCGLDAVASPFIAANPSYQPLGNKLYIPARCHHKFTALTRVHYECQFIAREPGTGQPALVWNGWKKAAE